MGIWVLGNEQGYGLDYEEESSEENQRSDEESDLTSEPLHCEVVRNQSGYDHHHSLQRGCNQQDVREVREEVAHQKRKNFDELSQHHRSSEIVILEKPVTEKKGSSAEQRGEDVPDPSDCASPVQIAVILGERNRPDAVSTESAEDEHDESGFEAVGIFTLKGFREFVTRFI